MRSLGQRAGAAHKGRREITVADVVSRYRDEVAPRKRGADRETLVLNAFLRHPLAHQASPAREAGHDKPGTVHY